VYCVARNAGPPVLVVVFEYEAPGRFLWFADSDEEELKLRRWLRGSKMLEYLPAVLAHVLEDEGDELGDAA